MNQATAWDPSRGERATGALAGHHARGLIRLPETCTASATATTMSHASVEFQSVNHLEIAKWGEGLQNQLRKLARSNTVRRGACGFTSHRIAPPSANWIVSLTDALFVLRRLG